MKLIYFTIIGLSTLLLSQACQRQRPAPKKPKAEIEVLDTTPAVFDTLVKQIPKTQTPTEVSIEKYMSGNIDKKYLKAFFIGKPYKTIEGSIETLQWPKDHNRNWYYLNSPYTENNWTSFVVYNSEDQAFFICTFTPKGQMIDALKLAYLEKRESGALTVKAFLSPDKSITIKGSFMSKELDVPDAEYSANFQIDANGNFNQIGSPPDLKNGTEKSESKQEKPKTESKFESKKEKRKI
jgi:hypothetical protein